MSLDFSFLFFFLSSVKLLERGSALYLMIKSQAFLVGPSTFIRVSEPLLFVPLCETGRLEGLAWSN